MTLRCEVQEHTVDWWYTWFKDGNPIGNSFEMQTLTYERVISRVSGVYKCIAAHKTDSREAESEPYHISVLDLPDSTVTVVSPLPPFSSGDTVTLSCDIAQTEGWDYKWEKDWSLVPNKTSKHITVSLPRENGQYCCYGQRKGSPSVFSSKSDLVDIFISVSVPHSGTFLLATVAVVAGLVIILVVITILFLLYHFKKMEGFVTQTTLPGTNHRSNQDQSQPAGSDGVQSEYMPLQRGTADVYENLKISHGQRDGNEEDYDDMA